MEQRLRRLVDLIFEGVEENYAEVKKDLEERGIFPDKLTEELLAKLDNNRNQFGNADNKNTNNGFGNMDIIKQTKELEKKILELKTKSLVFYINNLAGKEKEKEEEKEKKDA